MSSSSASASPTGKKVISIQPHLFKLKSKTVKGGRNRPPIDTSKIKEQLVGNILKRRKEKLKQEMEMQKKKEETEFDKSFNFMLQEKEQAREGQETKLRKTIKHDRGFSAGGGGAAAAASSPTVMVNVEWPNENGELTKMEWSDNALEETMQEPNIHQIGNSMLNYHIDNEIKYGCLKGGLKKTFKNLSGIGGGHLHNKTVSAGRVQFNPAMVAGPTIVIHPTPAPAPAPPPPPHSPSPPVAAGFLHSNSLEHSANIPQAPAPAPIVVQTPIVLPAPAPPIILPSPTNIPTTISTSTVLTPQANPSLKSVSIEESHLNPPEPEYVPKEVVLDTPSHAVPKAITEQTMEDTFANPAGGGGVRRKKTKVTRPSIKEIVKRKTLKFSYKLGKNKTFHNRIAVLSTSKPRIKLIQDAKQELQKTSIEKMRTYLMDRNLLSSGSSSPPEVIRQMYTEANLAADITNHNNETLLENYLETRH